MFETGAKNLKKGSSLLRLRIGLRYQFIDSVKKAYPIVLLCKIIKVSRGGYYAWQKRVSRAIKKRMKGLFT